MGKTVTINKTANHLFNRPTYGMIEFQNSIRKAIDTANGLDVRFVRLEDDLRIDYKRSVKRSSKCRQEIINISSGGNLPKMDIMLKVEPIV